MELEGTLRIQAFFTALPLAFGLLHFFLYAAMPRQRSNLYYALFLVLMAVSIFMDFQSQLTGARAVASLHRASLALSVIFALRFFYEISTDRLPAQFKYLVAALLITGAMAAVRPQAFLTPLQIVLLIALLESLRTTFASVRRGQEGAKLIGVGFIVFLIFAMYDLALDFGLMGALANVQNAYQFGLVGVFIASSAYLAQGIARTNEQLVQHERAVREREVENRLLEAEVERTKRELEEARVLQLSLLPSEVPRRRGLDIAVHLSTAAEVGGDYYDFRESTDGLLTVAVGDATGHGMRAGIMVAITKSLFHGLRDDESLPDFFNRCTSILKPMRLGNLFMGLTLVRVRRDGLTIAAAGMPPALLYHAGRDRVEQLTLKGMPLGAFANFEYEHTWVPFGPSDVLLLMSDGLPEQFNESREMLGMPLVRSAFQSVAQRSPEAIAAHLRRIAAEWRGEATQEDDLTIVVLKATAADENPPLPEA